MHCSSDRNRLDRLVGPLTVGASLMQISTHKFLLLSLPADYWLRTDCFVLEHLKNAGYRLRSHRPRTPTENVNCQNKKNKQWPIGSIVRRTLGSFLIGFLWDDGASGGMEMHQTRSQPDRKFFLWQRGWIDTRSFRISQF